MPSEVCNETAPAKLLVAIKQFNRGEYYKCHDTLEEMWMAETRSIRDLYKGILQIGVAFYHLGNKRHRPAVTLLQRGSGYVRPFGPTCLGLDLAHLLAAADRCLNEVKELEPDRLDDFDWSGVPKIHYEE